METRATKLFESGLPLVLSEQGIEFGEEMQKTMPSVRSFGDLQGVFESIPKNPQSPAYFMYRDVCLEKDRKKIRESGLRYDITVIPPAIVGKEFVKTLGHSHPAAPGTKISFPEVYEVILGKAHFILQGQTECFLFEAVAGEKVLIVPDMAHFTVNPSDEILVLSNWVERHFASDYSRVKEKRGAALYETTDGWVKNMHYLENFSMRFAKPKNVPEFGLEKSRPMYNVVNEIEKLEFLKNPQKFEGVFAEYIGKN